MHLVTLTVILSTVALLFPAAAQAYVGPTLGLGLVGTVIAVVAVLLLSLFAFVFLPIRRLLKKNRQKSLDEDVDS